MRLFDSHCHLQDERLARGLPEVLLRAREAGVAGFLCCATASDDWPGVAGLAARHPEIIPAFGLHPWYTERRTPDWLGGLREILMAHPGAAVGEIGLDRAMEGRDDGEQREIFTRQMGLAVELGRPVSVHCRKAWAELLDCLERLERRPPAVVIHSYSGSVEMLERLGAPDVWFSFSGSVTWPAHRRGREAVCAVPLDRLLIETDSPDILPRIPGLDPGGLARVESDINEPANLVHVLRAIAALRGIPEDELAESLWANAGRALGVRAPN